MRAFLFSLVIAAACGGGGPSVKRPEPVSGPDLSPALAPVRWMVGDWEHEGGREHWVAAAGVFYGVAFAADGGFEVMIVDDAPADAEGAPDGTLRLYAMPGGADEVLFTRVAGEGAGLRFENPQHDDPKAIVYEPATGGLVATVIGADADNPMTLPMTEISGEPFPDAEDADRGFAKATDAGGIDGWLAAFAADGAMMRGGKRVEGADAIRGLMGPMLGRGDLLWEPTWSRQSADGNFAATVGRARMVSQARVTWRGSYVTIWRRSAEGWKVVFDTGRGENPLE